MSVDTALSLDGTGRLDYALKQGPKRDVLLRRALQGATSRPAGPSRLEVKFRTRGKSGTLLHVQESSNYTTVKVGHLLIAQQKLFHDPEEEFLTRIQFQTEQNRCLHPLILVNTESESGSRGNRTPWKRLERLLADKLSAELRDVSNNRGTKGRLWVLSFLFTSSEQHRRAKRQPPGQHERADTIWETFLFT